MQKSLAIIIPAYKEKYFRNTLESIANQTCKDFHLYIGDDCSPYDLESVVKEFEDIIPMTYRRFDKNLGATDLVAQWERCIAMSESEPYIWLFSDDDTMSPYAVEQALSYFKDTKDVDLIRLGVEVIDADGESIREVEFPEVITPKELYLGKLMAKLECYVVEYIFTRKIYNELKGFVSFDLAWGSDLATWVKMAHGHNISTIGSQLVFWRNSGINISTTESAEILERKATALVNFLKWGEEYFKNDKDVKIANQTGLVRRLVQMSSLTHSGFGVKHLDAYAGKHWNSLNVYAHYLLRYLVKRMLRFRNTLNKGN